LIFSFAIPSIRHSMARRWMRRRYHTEAKSFSLLTQSSLFIFCLRPIAAAGLGRRRPAGCKPPA